MGIVWISVPAHDHANRFNAVASMGTLGTVFFVRVVVFLRRQHFVSI
jgi:hypothetical protein